MHKARDARDMYDRKTPGNTCMKVYGNLSIYLDTRAWGVMMETPYTTARS